MKYATLAAVVIATVATSAANAQLSVYPAKGQSPELQQKDEAECYNAAAQQSGYDPARQGGTWSHGTSVGDALVNSIGGAVGGAAGQVGQFANGVTNGVTSGSVRQPQIASIDRQQVDYNKARDACLTNRGYVLK